MGRPLARAEAAYNEKRQPSAAAAAARPSRIVLMRVEPRPGIVARASVRPRERGQDIHTNLAASNK